MKPTHLFLQALIFVCFDCFSQNYLLMPDSAGRWKEVMITCRENPIKLEREYTRGYKDYISSGDTTINDTLYFKILENDTGIGSMRQDSCKIFYRPYETGKEFLLYDFCITDRFYSPVFEIEFEVTYTDSVEYGGVKRKRWFFNDTEGHQVGKYWIEGIGSGGGLLKPESYLQLITCQGCCGGEQKLVCFTSGGNLYYLDEEYFNCDSLLSSAEDYTLSDFVEIYPNPSGGKITLKAVTPEEIESIEIFTINGKLIVNKLKPFKEVMELSLDSPGLYFIKISFSSGIVTKKLLLNKQNRE